MATTTETLSVRVTEEQREKVARMARAAGSTESWVMRALIDSSQLVAGAMFVGAVALPQQGGEVKNG